MHAMDDHLTPYAGMDDAAEEPDFVSRVVREISPFCRVVGDLGPKDARKNAFAIMHEHGGNELARLRLGAHTLAPYIGQQMEVYGMQDAITHVAGLANVRFLLEGVCRDPVEYHEKVMDALMNYPRSARMYVERVLAASGISDIGQMASATAEKVQRLFAEGEKAEAVRELKRVGGGFEYAEVLVAKGNHDVVERIHGLDLPYLEKKKIYDAVMAQVMDENIPEEEALELADKEFVPWFESVNERIIDVLGHSLKEGDTGIIVLGGSHFHSGKMRKQADALQGLHVEDAFVKSDVKDTRLIVCEPLRYRIHKLF